MGLGRRIRCAPTYSWRGAARLAGRLLAGGCGFHLWSPLTGPQLGFGCSRRWAEEELSDPVAAVTVPVPVEK